MYDAAQDRVQLKTTRFNHQILFYLFKYLYIIYLTKKYILKGNVKVTIVFFYRVGRLVYLASGPQYQCLFMNRIV